MVAMHRRRGVGVKAVKKKEREKESYAKVSTAMEATESRHVEEISGVLAGLGWGRGNVVKL